MFEEYQFGSWREVKTAGTLRSHEGTCGGGSENIVIDEKIPRTAGTLVAGYAKCYNDNPFERGYAIRQQHSVRRLTPLECERLQSLPDGWTYLPGNKTCSDSARYRALGNGMAQCCPTWLLKRLVKAVEECEE